MPRQPAPPSDRAQRVAAMQRSARAGERRRMSAIWIGLALVLALIAALVAWAILDEVRNQPDMSTVQVIDDPDDPSDDLSRTHVRTVPTYDHTPPVGGDHHEAWWRCGSYDEPIPDHHAVHSLEHGAIWLTYQPDLPAEELEQLRDVADQDFLLLSPYEGQDAPIVATAWGHRLTLDTADDDRLEEFVREYKQGPQTPELGAACTGGTTTDLLVG